MTAGSGCTSFVRSQISKMIGVSSQLLLGYRSIDVPSHTSYTKRDLSFRMGPSNK